MPGVVLMENAGRNAAVLVHELWPSGRVDVVCGRGNNAGDGFVMARHLELLGRGVRLLLAAAPDELAGDAAVNHRIAATAGIPLLPLHDADAAAWTRVLADGGIIVDALLGTGAMGPPRATIATAIDAINAARASSHGARVFAVDLPSGLDCDSGTAPGACVRADATGTFVARKIGFDNPASLQFTGDVHVLGIGAPRLLLAEFDATSGTVPPPRLSDGRLSPELLEAMTSRARAVSQRAHCPYSRFQVGAVVLADDGSFHEGCNVENVSYGLTICAERSAVARLIAAGKSRIVAVCVFTPTKEPVAPCGACRQVIHGFGPDAIVVSACDGPDLLVRRMGELLPDAFGTQAVPVTAPSERP